MIGRGARLCCTGGVHDFHRIGDVEDVVGRFVVDGNKLLLDERGEIAIIFTQNLPVVVLFFQEMCVERPLTAVSHDGGKCLRAGEGHLLGEVGRLEKGIFQGVLGTQRQIFFSRQSLGGHLDTQKKCSASGAGQSRGDNGAEETSWERVCGARDLSVSDAARERSHRQMSYV